MAGRNRTLIHKVRNAAGDLASATSVVLSNEAETYGVKRNDTDEVIVDAGEEMTQVDVGVYKFVVDEVFAGVEYTWSVKQVLDGETTYVEKTFFVSALPISALPCYVTLEEYEALAPYDLPDGFGDLEEAQQLNLLTMGTMRLDQIWWQGQKYVATQELQFPRFDNTRGWTVATGWGKPTNTSDIVVPNAIKLACIYEAASLADGRRREITDAIANGLSAQSVGKRSES